MEQAMTSGLKFTCTESEHEVPQTTTEAQI